MTDNQPQDGSASPPKLNVGMIAGFSMGAIALVVAALIFMVKPKSDEAMAGPVKEIKWTDLRMYDYKTHKGPDWLLGLNGKPVKIAGFVVPMEARPVTREFVFVPNQLACIHVPPPPPNLMIYVRMPSDVKLEDLQGPQWLSGTLVINDTDSPFGNISYVVNGQKLEAYQY